MSKKNIGTIFSKSNEGYCVYYPSIFFPNSHSSWGIFSDVTRFDHLGVSENS